MNDGGQRPEPDPQHLRHLFVYGTLMRGQCRARHWPLPPVRIDPATIRAALYDLGAYPGIAEGNELVRGEVWELRPEDMAGTLRVLDAVEGHAKRDDDLYVRRAVRCHLYDGQEVFAWTYFYARPAELSESRRMPAGPGGWSCWPNGPLANP